MFRKIGPSQVPTPNNKISSVKKTSIRTEMATLIMDLRRHGQHGQIKRRARKREELYFSSKKRDELCIKQRDGWTLERNRSCITSRTYNETL